MKKGLLWLSFALLLCFALPFVCQKAENSVSADTVFVPQQIEISEIGQLQDITIDGQTLYITDKTKKLVYCFNTQTNTYSTLNVQSFGIPDRLSFNYADNLVFDVSNVNKIIFNDSNKTEYSTFLIDGTPYNFTSILDIAQSSTNTVFALVVGDGKHYLVKKESNEQNFSSVCELQNVVDGAKLAVSLTGTTVLLLSNDTLYDLSNATQVEQTAFNVSTISNITSVYLDHRNNLFVLSKDNAIFKCNQTTQQKIDIQNTSDVVDFCLNPFNDTIYLITPTQLSKVETNEFLSPITTTPSVDIETDTTTTPLRSGNLKVDSFIYTYDNLMQKTKSIKAHTGIVVLDSMEGGNFYYILDTSSNKNVVGYVLKEEVAISSSTNDEKEYKTLFNTTNVYPFPTSLKTTDTTRVLTTLDKDTKVSAIQSYIVPNDSTGADFVCVEVVVNNSTVCGYIDLRTLTENNPEEQIHEIFVANAITKDDIDVFEDNELKTQMTTLNKDVDVQIISTDAGISFISWESQGQTFYGYTKYSNLSDGSITTAQIVGIFVMIVSLIALLVVLRFIKNYKKRFDLEYES